MTDAVDRIRESTTGDWRKRRHARLDHEVRHHSPTAAAVAAHERMRAAVAELGHVAIDTCPGSRELDQALHTLTDQVLAGFNAAIARNHDKLPVAQPQE